MGGFLKNNIHKTFIISSLIFLTLIIVNFISILVLNNFHFTYTIDDSYIHLALAEGISNFHYGINNNEYSSPSSSILWPFIIAPFIYLSIGHYIPFILNLLSSIGVLFIFWKIIILIFYAEPLHNKEINKLLMSLLFLFLTVTNLFSLIFSGMEHNVQIFFTALIVWGLITIAQKRRIPKWLAIAIIIAPLIRYENLALSFSSLLVVYLNGNKKISLILVISIILLVSGFSFFLISLNLEPLPLSILQKSSFMLSNWKIHSITRNIIDNVFNLKGILVIVITLFLSYKMFSYKIKREERLLIFCIILSMFLHVIFSKPGRYFEYLWVALILILLYSFREWIINFTTKNKIIKSAAITFLIVIFISYRFIYSISIITLASNNIYEQQYQMHRFAVDYYKQPVAVNDLGYIAYKNDNYVLDLVGLGSIEALNYWKNNDQTYWIDTISRKHKIKFAMIYESWFSHIPENWKKVGELHTGKMKISVSEKVVSFYLLDMNISDEINLLLYEFSNALPNDVKFVRYK